MKRPAMARRSAALPPAHTAAEIVVLPVEQRAPDFTMEFDARSAAGAPPPAEGPDPTIGFAGPLRILDFIKYNQLHGGNFL